MNNIASQETGPYPPPRPGTDDDIDHGLRQRRYQVEQFANIFVGLGAAPADKIRETSVESAVSALKDKLASGLRIDENDATALYRGILTAYGGMEMAMGEWTVPRVLGEIAHLLWSLAESNKNQVSG